MAGMADTQTTRIRSSRVALLPAVFLFVFVTPVAGVARWLLVVYAIPLLLVVWVIRAGIDIDAEGVTVRALLGSRRLPWSRVRGVTVSRRGQLRLLLTSGQALRLPFTRPAHLPLIRQASAGRLPETPVATA